MTHPIQITWVVGELNTPTMDFYFRSRQDQFENYAELCSQKLPPAEHPVWQCTSSRIILSRNVSLHWLKSLVKMKDKPQSIVWFIDDDIPVAALDDSLPKHYRKRLKFWYQEAFPLLSAICTDVWVSTPYLAKKYNLPAHTVLPPLQITVPTKPMIKCFYHGSSSHSLEWKFIKQFVSAVQERYDHIWFEIIGDHSLKKSFKDIARVSIIHPLNWQNYQSMIHSRDMDIGLAPLFDSPFNRARSHTKLLDIQRQGAIGIYSARFPFAEQIKNFKAGIICEDGLENWLEAFATALERDKEITIANTAQLLTQLNTEHLQCSAANSKLP
ncbi:hypothetical protein L9G16_08385 [Shewanella sp. A25]|nr:hypothetical protein [Shewanella shenzhenensis]